jgi:NADH-quinone oxidoreductase subunit N
MMPLPRINPHDFLYIVPEMALTAWGLIVLMVDFGLLRRQSPGRRQVVVGWLSLAGAVATVAAIAAQAPMYLDLPGWSTSASFNPDPTLFFGLLAGDAATFWLNLVVALLLALVVAMSMAWPFTEHWGEYYALLFWAAVGMMFLIAAEELLTLFLTLETMTLCLYLATAFEKGRRRSAEGGLKYFVYGSVSSALFLFGLSLVYGLTGTTRLEAIREALDVGGTASIGLAGNVAGATAVLLILVGFGFKVAAVPFHQWAPDAYEGAPAPVTAWVAAGSKLASFVAMMKVLVFGLGPWKHSGYQLLAPGWIGLVAIIAAVTMTYGNFAALAQRNLKRMLAYSSIAHAGYMLVGVLAASISVSRAEAAGSVLFYLITYAFTTVGAFALAAWLARDVGSDDLDDLNGLGARSPGLAVCIVILMLSLIGMPPLAGFFGKLYMFMEALNTREAGRLTLIGLVALGLANSVVSAFYYVRVLKAMFLRDPGRTPTGAAPGGIRWPILAATAVAVGFGLYPVPLLETSRGAATWMLAPPAGSRYATQADPNPPAVPRSATQPSPPGARLPTRGGAPAPASRPADTPPAPRSAEPPK